LAGLALVAGLTLIGSPEPAGANYRYHRAGAFLDYAKRPSLLKDFSPFAKFRIGPPGQGIYEVYPDGRTYFDPIDSAAYGLWHLTRYVEAPRRAHLRQAERAARWLRNRQNPLTGAYEVPYSYDAGGRTDGSNHLVLSAPWYGANVQGYALSLFSRLYRITHRRAYLRQALLALGPLSKPFGQSGVQAPFLDTGETFFEGYATLKVPVHTLSHHVHALLGLYDVSDLSPRARGLFEAAMRTLVVALPYYDLPAQGRTATWLAHLTDPPRPVFPLAGNHQEVLLAFLRALASVRPSPALRQYLRRWNAQLGAICRAPAEGCFFRH
jgi:hypothetical protein